MHQMMLSQHHHQSPPSHHSVHMRPHPAGSPGPNLHHLQQHHMHPQQIPQQGNQGQSKGSSANGESSSRPSVIESNQPLIIECT